MKMNLRINNATVESGQSTPAELRAMAQPIATKISELMRIHGIKALTAEPVLLGTRSILNKSYLPIEAQGMPMVYATARPEVVSLLAQYMSLFGLTHIEIEPGPEDIKVITDTWAQIIAQATALPATEQVKAAPTVDPDNKAIEP